MRIEPDATAIGARLTYSRWLLGGIIFTYGALHLVVSGLEGLSKLATVWGQVLFLSYLIFAIHGRKSLGAEVLPLACFATLVFAGIIWAPDTEKAASDASNLAQGMAVFLAISGLLRCKSLWNFAVAGYLAGSFLLIGVTLASGEWAFLVGESTGRLAGTTGNANRFGFAMLICLALSMIVWSEWKHPMQRAFLFIAGIISLVCLVASGSRMGFLGLSLFLLFFFFARLRIHYRKVPRYTIHAMVFMVLVTVGLIYVANNTILGKRLFQGGGSAKSSNSERLNLVKKGIALSDEHLVFGVGTGGFRSYPPMWGRSPHNNHFEILVNHGLVGYAFFCCFFGLIVIRLFGLSIREWDGSNYAKGLLSLCLMIFPLIFFCVVIYFKPFWYCLGLASGVSLHLAELKGQSSA